MAELADNAAASNHGYPEFIGLRQVQRFPWRWKSDENKGNERSSNMWGPPKITIL